MRKAAAQLIKEMTEFLEIYPLRTYRKGQNLIYKGDRLDSVFVLIEGKVKQYAISDEGNEIIVNIFHDYAFFPTQITTVKSDHYFDTLTDVRLRVVPIRLFVEHLQTSKELLMNMLTYIQLFNQETISRITHLMASSAYYRLANELILECKSNPVSNNDSYLLGLHEHELASRSGMSRETASRQMKKMKSKGLVSVNHKTVEVLSLKRLVQELNGHI